MATNDINSQINDSVISAQTGHHDAIRFNIHAPAAVIFNHGASADDHLSFAHGQLTIATQLLTALAEGDGSSDVYYAIRSILEPATKAVHIAADTIRRSQEH